MKIHEYQAKTILSEFGIPIPRAGVASTPLEARQIAQELGGGTVVKAQVHAGGRGLAGGVKAVDSPQEAETVALSLLGHRLITHQTGTEGAQVSQVLVEEQVQVSREYYLAITMDSSARCPVVMACEAGGMEIEEVAAKAPERILSTRVNTAIGLQPFQCRGLAYGMNMPAELVGPTTAMIANLYRLFEAKDCSLAEINPLAVTSDGGLLALDAKLNFDDDALFRHPEIAALRDSEQDEPLEVEADRIGISYIKLDGDVGCLVNGAGLAMATMDVISAAGAMPANFLDVGGGPSEERVRDAFSLLLSDPQVKRILVNVFGGILRCDLAARGIVAACQEARTNVPIVVRMLGTNAEEGRDVLAQSGLGIILVNNLSEAAAEIKRAGAST